MVTQQREPAVQRAPVPRSTRAATELDARLAESPRVAQLQATRAQLSSSPRVAQLERTSGDLLANAPIQMRGKGKRSKHPSKKKRERIRAAKKRYVDRRDAAASKPKRKGYQPPSNKDKQRLDAPIDRRNLTPRTRPSYANERGPGPQRSPGLTRGRGEQETADNPKLLLGLLKLGNMSLDIAPNIGSSDEEGRELTSKERGGMIRVVLKANELLNSPSHEATKRYLAVLYEKALANPSLIDKVQLRVGAVGDDEGGHYSRGNAELVLKIGDDTEDDGVQFQNPATVLSTIVHEFTHFYDYLLADENPQITDPRTGGPIDYADYRQGMGSFDPDTQRRYLRSVLPERVFRGYAGVRPWSELIARFSEVGATGGAPRPLAKGLKEYDDGLLAGAQEGPSERLGNIQSSVVLPFIEAADDPDVSAYFTQSMLQLPSGESIVATETETAQREQAQQMAFLLAMMMAGNDDDEY